MSPAIGFVLNSLPHLADPSSTAERAALLVALVALLLLYRSLREPYLMLWSAGWGFFLLYRVAASAGASPDNRVLLALAHGGFVLALLFFISGISVYVDARWRFAPVLSLALVCLVTAIARALYWPDSQRFMLAIHGMYMLLTVGGAVELALFSRGRRQVAPWLLTAVLVMLHLDESGTAHWLPSTDLVIEFLLGLSMVMLALDQARQRSRQLRAVNAIATAIAQAQSPDPMMATGLEQLRKLFHARAAWFRLLDGDHLTIKHHIGLSDEFVASRRQVDAHSSFGAEVIGRGVPTVLRATQARDPVTQEQFAKQGLDHAVMVPVKGKSSSVGCLALGLARYRTYTRDEIRFLGATANQLGIALENLVMMEQILRSQRQWVSTFDSIQDMVLVHDADTRIIKLNRALLSRLGRDYLQVMKQRCDAVLPRINPGATGCPYCQRPALIDAPDPCWGGFSLVTTSSYSEGDGPLGTIHIIRDTTQNRAAEEKYRMLFEQVQEGVFISTREGRILECNDALVRMLGYGSREELLALDLSREIYADPVQREAFQREISTHSFVRNYELKFRRKDGSIVTVLENSHVTRDLKGEITGYQGFVLDTTEKKRVEDEIRRHNRQLHALNEIAVIATQSFDLDEILNVALRQVVELLSADTGAVYLTEENQRMRRRAAWGLLSQANESDAECELPEDYWTKLQAAHIELITETTTAAANPVHERFIAGEGLRSWIWVVMWNKDKPVGFCEVGSRQPGAFSVADQQLMVAIGRQLASTIDKVHMYEETCRAYEYLRRTQEQLLQSEKMAAIGQLISGVAHELNNPLTAILGYSQLLEGEDLTEHSRDFIQKIFRQAQRTHRVVQNLLSFARQRKPLKMQIDLCRVLDDTLILRDYDLQLSNVVVTREYSSSLPVVVADAHQMEQVFLNIINNAVDAMLESGSGGRLGVRVFADKGCVCVEFSDSGPGISDPKRIFDPFYTTKAVGKGTGLGLSICYGIVKEHGGDIVARNHPQGGAVFEIRLPAAVAEMPAQPEAKRPQHALLHGRILIVDDEDMVAEFEREVLTGAGAQVVAVARAREAIEQLQKSSFDAVIVGDGREGAWAGKEVYDWARETNSGLHQKMIFTISNSSNSEARRFLEEVQSLHINKPFDLADFISLVRRAMQAGAGGTEDTGAAGAKSSST